MTAPDPAPPARHGETPAPPTSRAGTPAPRARLTEVPAPSFTILAAGGAGVCEGNVCEVPPVTPTPGDDVSPGSPPGRR